MTLRTRQRSNLIIINSSNLIRYVLLMFRAENDLTSHHMYIQVLTHRAIQGSQIPYSVCSSFGILAIPFPRFSFCGQHGYSCVRLSCSPISDCACMFRGGD